MRRGDHFDGFLISGPLLDPKLTTNHDAFTSRSWPLASFSYAILTSDTFWLRNHVTHTRADWLLISGPKVDPKLKTRQSDRRAAYVLKSRSFILLWSMYSWFQGILRDYKTFDRRSLLSPTVET